jgi:tetratricopeptide (TPR) repeat protein
MARWWLLALLPMAATAAEHWTRFTSGPFEVMSSAGTKDGRETLVFFEEFRHALGNALGEDDLETPLPVRILLFRGGAPATPEPVIHGRDFYAIALTAGRPPGTEVMAALTRLLLETTMNRMPDRIEHGMVELFSTIQVTGIRITLGLPPTHPDMDWARIQLLVTNPAYAGKLRVLTYNLRRGADEDASFRNAFDRTPEQIELEAQQLLASGHFQTASISPRAMSPADFPERSVEADTADLALADLLLGDSSRATYKALIARKAAVPEAWEGLGMLALRAHDTDEARKDFAAAMQAGSKSASCYMEYARLESDNAKAMDALEHAAKLNPKLAEVHFLMAQHQTDSPKRIQQLKEAAKLDPRNLNYWQALAEAYLAGKDFAQAAQAWRSAEQAASTPVDRARMQRARLDIEQQRLDWEAAERQRKADEDARELDRLKAEARAEVHALEARANQGNTPSSGSKAVPWWDGAKPGGETTGVLKQVDCLGKRMRLVVVGDNHETIKLLVTDPAQVSVLNGAQSFGCGSQPGRRVRVEYFPKANAKMATAGEVATIEFQ